VNADETGKVEKAIKEMRNKQAMRNDVLRLLGENGFRLIRQPSTTQAYMKLRNYSGISVKLQSLPYRRSKKLQKAATNAQSATSHTQQML
jgi:hypothetical protein